MEKEIRKMPTLTVSFKNVNQVEHPLFGSQSWTIGRRESNDFVVDNIAVSSVHARIDKVEQGYLLTDLNSKNGTMVGGKLVSSHWLTDGDVITVGKHQLIFGLTEEEAPQPDNGGAIDQTMVLDTSSFREMLESNMPEEKTAMLNFVKGGNGEMELTKWITRLGSDKANDIHVRGIFVGRFAATINRQDRGFQLRRIKGLARPRVNGRKVSDRVMLKEFDSIELGRAKIDFYFKKV
jgi:pSer/pThr/pTyr-binding forkhead associated (FHA) protein